MTQKNPIDWSCVANGTVVDTSALNLTNKQKYDIEIDNEKLQSKIIRSRSKRRTHTPLQHRANTRAD